MFLSIRTSFAYSSCSSLNFVRYFSVYVKNGKLEYCIIDDNFGQPSPANYSDTDYAKMLRNRSSKILESLVKLGYIEELKK